MIKEILELIDAIFDALFKSRECKLKRKYIEYVPGQQLHIPDEPELAI